MVYRVSGDDDGDSWGKVGGGYGTDDSSRSDRVSSEGLDAEGSNKSVIKLLTNRDFKVANGTIAGLLKAGNLPDYIFSQLQEAARKEETEFLINSNNLDDAIAYVNTHRKELKAKGLNPDIVLLKIDIEKALAFAEKADDLDQAIYLLAKALKDGKVGDATFDEDDRKGLLQQLVTVMAEQASKRANGDASKGRDFVKGIQDAKKIVVSVKIKTTKDGKVVEEKFEHTFGEGEVEKIKQKLTVLHESLTIEALSQGTPDETGSAKIALDYLKANRTKLRAEKTCFTDEQYDGQVMKLEIAVIQENNGLRAAWERLNKIYPDLVRVLGSVMAKQYREQMKVKMITMGLAVEGVSSLGPQGAVDYLKAMHDTYLSQDKDGYPTGEFRFSLREYQKLMVEAEIALMAQNNENLHDYLVKQDSALRRLGINPSTFLKHVDMLEQFGIVTPEEGQRIVNQNSGFLAERGLSAKMLLVQFQIDELTQKGDVGSVEKAKAIVDQSDDLFLRPLMIQHTAKYTSLMALLLADKYEEAEALVASWQGTIPISLATKVLEYVGLRKTIHEIRFAVVIENLPDQLDWYTPTTNLKATDQGIIFADGLPEEARRAYVADLQRMLASVMDESHSYYLRGTEGIDWKPGIMDAGTALAMYRFVTRNSRATSNPEESVKGLKKEKFAREFKAREHQEVGAPRKFPLTWSKENEVDLRTDFMAAGQQPQGLVLMLGATRLGFTVRVEMFKEGGAARTAARTANNLHFITVMLDYLEQVTTDTAGQSTIARLKKWLVGNADLSQADLQWFYGRAVAVDINEKQIAKLIGPDMKKSTRTAESLPDIMRTGTTVVIAKQNDQCPINLAIVGSKLGRAIRNAFDLEVAPKLKAEQTQQFKVLDFMFCFVDYLILERPEKKAQLTAIREALLSGTVLTTDQLKLLSESMKLVGERGTLDLKKVRQIVLQWADNPESVDVKALPLVRMLPNGSFVVPETAAPVAPNQGTNVVLNPPYFMQLGEAKLSYWISLYIQGGGRLAYVYRGSAVAPRILAAEDLIAMAEYESKRTNLASVHALTPKLADFFVKRIGELAERLSDPSLTDEQKAAITIEKTALEEIVADQTIPILKAKRDELVTRKAAEGKLSGDDVIITDLLNDLLSDTAKVEGKILQIINPPVTEQKTEEGEIKRRYLLKIREEQKERRKEKGVSLPAIALIKKLPVGTELKADLGIFLANLYPDQENMGGFSPEGIRGLKQLAADLKTEGKRLDFAYLTQYVKDHPENEGAKALLDKIKAAGTAQAVEPMAKAYQMAPAVFNLGLNSKPPVFLLKLLKQRWARETGLLFRANELDFRIRQLQEMIRNGQVTVELYLELDQANQELQGIVQLLDSEVIPRDFLIWFLNLRNRDENEPAMRELVPLLPAGWLKGKYLSQLNLINYRDLVTNEVMDLPKALALLQSADVDLSRISDQWQVRGVLDSLEPVVEGSTTDRGQMLRIKQALAFVFNTLATPDKMPAIMGSKGLYRNHKWFQVWNANWWKTDYTQELVMLKVQCMNYYRNFLFDSGRDREFYLATLQDIRSSKAFNRYDLEIFVELLKSSSLKQRESLIITIKAALEGKDAFEANGKTLKLDAMVSFNGEQISVKDFLVELYRALFNAAGQDVAPDVPVGNPNAATIDSVTEPAPNVLTYFLPPGDSDYRVMAMKNMAEAWGSFEIGDLPGFIGRYFTEYASQFLSLQFSLRFRMIENIYFDLPKEVLVELSNGNPAQLFRLMALYFWPRLVVLWYREMFMEFIREKPDYAKILAMFTLMNYITTSGGWKSAWGRTLTMDAELLQSAKSIPGLEKFVSDWVESVPEWKASGNVFKKWFANQLDLANRGGRTRVFAENNPRVAKVMNQALSVYLSGPGGWARPAIDRAKKSLYSPDMREGQVDSPRMRLAKKAGRMALMLPDVGYIAFGTAVDLATRGVKKVGGAALRGAKYMTGRSDPTLMPTLNTDAAAVDQAPLTGQGTKPEHADKFIAQVAPEASQVRDNVKGKRVVADPKTILSGDQVAFLTYVTAEHQRLTRKGRLKFESFEAFGDNAKPIWDSLVAANCIDSEGNIQDGFRDGLKQLKGINSGSLKKVTGMFDLAVNGQLLRHRQLQTLLLANDKAGLEDPEKQGHIHRNVAFRVETGGGKSWLGLYTALYQAREAKMGSVPSGPVYLVTTDDELVRQLQENQSQVREIFEKFGIKVGFRYSEGHENGKGQNLKDIYGCDVIVISVSQLAFDYSKEPELVKPGTVICDEFDFYFVETAATNYILTEPKGQTGNLVLDTAGLAKYRLSWHQTYELAKDIHEHPSRYLDENGKLTKAGMRRMVLRGVWPNIETMARLQAFQQAFQILKEKGIPVDQKGDVKLGVENTSGLAQDIVFQVLYRDSSGKLYNQREVDAINERVAAGQAKPIKFVPSKIVPLDPSGEQAPNKNLGNGLQEALSMILGIEISQENVTLADVDVRRLFRFLTSNGNRVIGMTGSGGFSELVARAYPELDILTVDMPPFIPRQQLSIEAMDRLTSADPAERLAAAEVHFTALAAAIRKAQQEGDAIEDVYAKLILPGSRAGQIATLEAEWIKWINADPSRADLKGVRISVVQTRRLFVYDKAARISAAVKEALETAASDQAAMIGLENEDDIRLFRSEFERQSPGRKINYLESGPGFKDAKERAGKPGEITVTLFARGLDIGVIIPEVGDESGGLGSVFMKGGLHVISFDAPTLAKLLQTAGRGSRSIFPGGSTSYIGAGAKVLDREAIGETRDRLDAAFEKNETLRGHVFDLDETGDPMVATLQVITERGYDNLYQKNFRDLVRNFSESDQRQNLTEITAQLFSLSGDPLTFAAAVLDNTLDAIFDGLGIEDGTRLTAIQKTDLENQLTRLLGGRRIKLDIPAGQHGTVISRAQLKQAISQKVMSVFSKLRQADPRVETPLEYVDEEGVARRLSPSRLGRQNVVGKTNADINEELSTIDRESSMAGVDGAERRAQMASERSGKLLVLLMHRLFPSTSLYNLARPGTHTFRAIEVTWDDYSRAENQGEEPTPEPSTQGGEGPAAEPTAKPKAAPTAAPAAAPEAERAAPAKTVVVLPEGTQVAGGRVIRVGELHPAIQNKFGNVKYIFVPEGVAVGTRFSIAEGWGEKLGDATVLIMTRNQQGNLVFNSATTTSRLFNKGKIVFTGPSDFFEKLMVENPAQFEEMIDVMQQKGIEKLQVEGNVEFNAASIWDFLAAMRRLADGAGKGKVFKVEGSKADPENLTWKLVLPQAQPGPETVEPPPAGTSTRTQARHRPTRARSASRAKPPVAKEVIEPSFAGGEIVGGLNRKAAPAKLQLVSARKTAGAAEKPLAFAIPGHELGTEEGAEKIGKLLEKIGFDDQVLIRSEERIRFSGMRSELVQWVNGEAVLDTVLTRAGVMVKKAGGEVDIIDAQTMGEIVELLNQLPADGVPREVQQIKLASGRTARIALNRRTGEVVLIVDAQESLAEIRITLSVKEYQALTKGISAFKKIFEAAIKRNKGANPEELRMRLSTLVEQVRAALKAKPSAVSLSFDEALYEFAGTRAEAEAKFMEARVEIDFAGERVSLSLKLSDIQTIALYPKDSFKYQVAIRNLRRALEVSGIKDPTKLESLIKAYETEARAAAFRVQSLDHSAKVAQLTALRVYEAALAQISPNTPPKEMQAAVKKAQGKAQEAFAIVMQEGYQEMLRRAADLDTLKLSEDEVRRIYADKVRKAGEKVEGMNDEQMEAAINATAKAFTLDPTRMGRAAYLKLYAPGGTLGDKMLAVEYSAGRMALMGLVLSAAFAAVKLYRERGLSNLPYDQLVKEALMGSLGWARFAALDSVGQAFNAFEAGKTAGSVAKKASAMAIVLTHLWSLAEAGPQDRGKVLVSGAAGLGGFLLFSHLVRKALPNSEWISAALGLIGSNVAESAIQGLVAYSPTFRTILESDALNFAGNVGAYTTPVLTGAFWGTTAENILVRLGVRSALAGTISTVLADLTAGIGVLLWTEADPSREVARYEGDLFTYARKGYYLVRGPHEQFFAAPALTTGQEEESLDPSDPMWFETAIYLRQQGYLPDLKATYAEDLTEILTILEKVDFSDQSSVRNAFAKYRSILSNERTRKAFYKSVSLARDLFVKRARAAGFSASAVKSQSGTRIPTHEIEGARELAEKSGGKLQPALKKAYLDHIWVDEKRRYGDFIFQRRDDAKKAAENLDQQIAEMRQSADASVAKVLDGFKKDQIAAIAKELGVDRKVAEKIRDLVFSNATTAACVQEIMGIIGSGREVSFEAARVQTMVELIREGYKACQAQADLKSIQLHEKGGTTKTDFLTRQGYYDFLKAKGISESNFEEYSQGEKLVENYSAFLLQVWRVDTYQGVIRAIGTFGETESALPEATDPNFRTALDYKVQIRAAYEAYLEEHPTASVESFAKYYTQMLWEDNSEQLRTDASHRMGTGEMNLVLMPRKAREGLMEYIRANDSGLYRQLTVETGDQFTPDMAMLLISGQLKVKK